MPSTSLRLITVPDTAPPYDCEAHGAACPAARDTAGHDTAGHDTAGHDTAGHDAAGHDTAGHDTAGVDLLGAGQPPEPLGPAWPLQFAQVVVEILAGARSPRQIIPCTTDSVRARIGALIPLLASDHRPRIQRILTSRPTAHAVEMSVVVSFGPRSRALAVRCEHLPARPAAPGLPPRPARWLCTELIAG
jgi:hypothetical protein